LRSIDDNNNPSVSLSLTLSLTHTHTHTQSALQVLNDVLSMAPREASVHFLLGKVYNKLKKYDKALMHFTKTLDLDPKDKNIVKSMIDKLLANASVNTHTHNSGSTGRSDVVNTSVDMNDSTDDVKE